MRCAATSSLRFLRGGAALVTAVAMAIVAFASMLLAAPALATPVPPVPHTQAGQYSYDAGWLSYDSAVDDALSQDAEPLASMVPIAKSEGSVAHPSDADPQIHDVSRSLVAPRPVAAGPTVLGGADNRLAAAATWIRPIDGYHDVVVHGTESGFAVLRNGQFVDIDHRTLSTFIQNSPDYAGGPIRLVSCSTGCGVAQDLSNKLGVDVLAPTNTAWIHPSGAVTVGPSPYVNSGSFDLFSPGGS